MAAAVHVWSCVPMEECSQIPRKVQYLVELVMANPKAKQNSLEQQHFDQLVVNPVAEEKLAVGMARVLELKDAQTVEDLMGVFKTIEQEYANNKGKEIGVDVLSALAVALQRVQQTKGESLDDLQRNVLSFFVLLKDREHIPRRAEVFVQSLQNQKKTC